ncbi:hypothetical protein BS47DRAFT_1402355 [Hydnum rufescens UP504]|uniref:Uncharacterized protein n=1 Tax=Hydnum rufescens UP504 TaxID=1448309 RepID=A0A9P6ACP8_9AGAM|nr:hypothetical protein BS47DRAFT_1402355 [Hydnum rufescens UP504]
MDPNLGASTLGSTNPGVVLQNWYAESFNTVLPPVTLDGFDFSHLVFNPDGDDTICTGIRFDQEVMNCKGKLLHCHLEYEAMHNWFEEEYEATILAEKYTPASSVPPNKAGDDMAAKDAKINVKEIMASLGHGNAKHDLHTTNDDGETELEPVAIYNAHVMEEIDNWAQEQEWESGEGAE